MIFKTLPIESMPGYVTQLAGCISNKLKKSAKRTNKLRRIDLSININIIILFFFSFFLRIIHQRLLHTLSYRWCLQGAYGTHCMADIFVKSCLLSTHYVWNLRLLVNNWCAHHSTERLLGNSMILKVPNKYHHKGLENHAQVVCPGLVNVCPKINISIKFRLLNVTAIAYIFVLRI